MKEHVFLKGTYLIKEGTTTNFAFIVKTGELKIVSSELPRRLNVKTDFTKGYYNPTINAFQLGKVFEKEWAGIEMLKLQGKEMPFSLIASTHVTAYRINMNKLQSEFKVRFIVIFSSCLWKSCTELRH
jgi:CRP-like cAMP-binding protein